jgi:hypothetical protein
VLEGWLAQWCGSVASGSDLPIVFAGRPSFGGVGLGCQPILFAATAASCRMQKARSGFSGAGLILATIKMSR